MPAQAAELRTAETTYRDAVREAIRDALRRDERVFLMGEDVGRYGGCYAVSKGLLAEFGPDRIRDTPLSESGFTGAGIGVNVPKLDYPKLMTLQGAISYLNARLPQG